MFQVIYSNISVKPEVRSELVVTSCLRNLLREGELEKNSCSDFQYDLYVKQRNILHNLNKAENFVILTIFELETNL